MRFTGESIHHNHHPYPTFGNYQSAGDFVRVTVSHAPDWRWEFCGLIHELVECYLCKHAGINEEDITRFDREFEAERAAHVHGAEDEPGDDPRCPYRRQHQVAMAIERIIGMALDVDWKAYNDWIATLP